MCFGYLVHCQNIIRMQKLRANYIKKKEKKEEEGKDDKIP